jgi:peptidoglycan/xylan/chitin deacetylase (PgdA/CDA1 family)
MITPLFPDGKAKCLTFSYDDGVTQDRRLVALFNKYGVRGTFNLNSGCFGRTGAITDTFNKEVTHNKIAGDEVATLYAGHEVAVHTLLHPNLCVLDRAAIRYEVMEDRRNLESLVGYPVTGMAYPYGTYDDTVTGVLRECGIHYSRTVVSTNSFGMPRDFLAWHPSCHFGDAGMDDLIRRFLADQPGHNEAGYQKLLYIWGHAYELDGCDTWELMEKTLAALSGRDDVWYATNIEIYRYQRALEALDFSENNSMVMNPGGQTVWIAVNDRPVELLAGTVVKL